MIIFKKAEALSEYLHAQKNSGRLIGFVPTMGALHAGHQSLIQQSKQAGELCTCSIFINPSQFNNQEDFKNYPITLEKDIEQLFTARCDVLFLPTVAEIYPPLLQQKSYDLGHLESILEGKFRPGHFQGVCQVVDRLLGITMPHRLYLGQKDYQQCLIIRKLIHLCGWEETITTQVVPTIRETDGLAMSSRNLRLDAHQRKIAPYIYRELLNIRENLHTASLHQLKERARVSLMKDGFQVDYVEISHSSDLQTAEDTSSSLIGLVAASIGPIRLIDNLLLH